MGNDLGKFGDLVSAEPSLQTITSDL